MNTVELITGSGDPREDFYFMEPCAIGLAEGVTKSASNSSSTDQFNLTPKQIIKNLIAFMCENFLKLDNSFFLELENSSFNFSFGTNKTPDSANLSSLDQTKQEKLLSVSQDLKDSASHMENRNAAICLLRADEVYCAISGESRITLIRFTENLPELVNLVSKITKKISRDDINGAKNLEEVKRDHTADSLKAYNVKIQVKDLLIVASANLFTIVSETEILELVRKYVKKEGFTETFPQILTKEIGNFARNTKENVSSIYIK